MTKIRKTITLAPEIAKKVDAKAKEENRTFSNFIENLLGKYFQKSKKKK
jgi:predicted CopG family antitoxin